MRREAARRGRPTRRRCPSRRVRDGGEGRCPARRTGRGWLGVCVTPRRAVDLWDGLTTVRATASQCARFASDPSMMTSNRDLVWLQRPDRPARVKTRLRQLARGCAVILARSSSQIRFAPAPIRLRRGFDPPGPPRRAPPCAAGPCPALPDGRGRGPALPCPALPCPALPRPCPALPCPARRPRPCPDRHARRPSCTRLPGPSGCCADCLREARRGRIDSPESVDRRCRRRCHSPSRAVSASAGAVAVTLRRARCRPPRSPAAQH
jgi:hypothetical protein